MKKLLILVMVMVLAGGFGGAARAEEASKFGYVDVKKIFEGYEKTKALEKQLEEAKGKKQGEREKMVADIERLKNELELLSDKAKEEKKKLVSDKVDSLTEFDHDIRTELTKQRDNMVRDVLKEVETAIQEYGKKEDYRMIFTEAVLLYGSEGDDLTGKVLEALNKKYQNK